MPTPDESTSTEALIAENERLRATLTAYTTVRSPGRPEGEAWERAATAWELLQRLNATLPPDQQWAMNQTLLSRRLGVKQDIAKQFLSKHQTAITAFNAALPRPAQRQNLGHDFEGLRQQLEDRLQAKQLAQQRSPLDAALQQQFLALLERSQRERQIRDPLAVTLLRQVRTAKGLTQKDLGQVLGQPQSVIAALEHGSRTLTPKLLKRYAQWLQLP